MPDADNGSKYAPAGDTARLLRTGDRYRRDRLQAKDMLMPDEAASLAGVDRNTIVGWIGNGRCIGIRHGRSAFKLPQWQFLPHPWPAVAAVAKALETTDGWVLLCFFESPLAALQGRTPRAALEQGSPLTSVIAAAAAVAH